ncbi:hypothetical protein AC1031_019454 [Aphanomyces cochlioides]|nr:hypothetical protein AC1031_019454 [Aphanomyces cochlioides]
MEKSRCEAVLEDSGIQESDLSQLGRRYLNILTQSALVLNLDQVDTTAFIAAIEDLSERKEAVDHDVAALRRELEAIQQQNDRARQELEHITHVHHSMRLMAEEREITENSLMFQHWARDYDEKEMLYRDEIVRLNLACEVLHLSRQNATQFWLRGDFLSMNRWSITPWSNWLNNASNLKPKTNYSKTNLMKLFPYPQMCKKLALLLSKQRWSYNNLKS